MTELCKRYGKRFIPWETCKECTVIEECNKETVIWFAKRLGKKVEVVGP